MQCTATSKRSGQQCRNAAVRGQRVCRMHGAHSRKGAASGRFVDGRYSKALPERLAARYAAAEADPELLNLRSEIALVESLITDALVTLDSGGAFTVFADLRRDWQQLLRLQAAGKTAEAGVVLKQIGEGIATGASAGQTLDALTRLIDQRRKLVESEQKRLVAMQQILTTEQAMTFVGVVMGAVKAHVTDAKQLSAISRDIERYALQAGQ